MHPTDITVPHPADDPLRHVPPVMPPPPSGHPDMTTLAGWMRVRTHIDPDTRNVVVDITHQDY
jgi:hypothetical protein